MFTKVITVVNSTKGMNTFRISTNMLVKKMKMYISTLSHVRS